MAERFAALSRVGTALMSELDETRLLHLIAETACSLTGATFAAFSLRPMNEGGQPLVPSEGNLFHLASVVGVTEEQEALFRRMPLGGEGLLAPIFRHGIPVLIPDALTQIAHAGDTQMSGMRDTARDIAVAYAHGQLPAEALRSMGVPRGHPLVRSFLGAPLLDHERLVRGGLLLGHSEPNQFTQEDEALLVGLASQAAVALENARLYRSVQMRVQELDAIFETIVDGVTLIDTHEHILRENSSARRLRERLQHYPAGEHALEALLYRPAQRALKDEAVQDVEVSVTDNDEETRDYVVNASPLLLPAASSDLPPQDACTGSSVRKPISGAVVVWHDVTEARRLLIERRVHAETEARRAVLQMVLDELPSSVYLVRGHDARLVLANHAAAAVWGAHWPVGQPMREFLKEHEIRISGIDGLPLPPDRLATLRTVQRGETVRQHQEIIRHADGTTLPVLVNAVPLNVHELYISPLDITNHLAEGLEPAALVVHQDVTALKEAEQLKDDFIGIAAHELRNPLATLKGFAQTLIVQTARGKGPELAEWQSEALQGIDQAVVRLTELTEDVLDVTRLQAGRLELHMIPIDLIPLIRRLVTRIQMTTEHHQLSISTSLSYLVVSVDPRRIEQIFSNLLNNAIKYSPEGGSIEVVIDQDEKTNLALIQITDHGIGIPSQQQARIFSRFARAENAQKYGIGGTGLGLYLCRELVERLGGRIWFESIEGEGSTFSFTLPLLAE